MSRNPKQKLEDENDKLWSEAVKIRANHKCQLGCGRTASDAHHVARKSASVRWDMDNGIALCRPEHDHDHEAEMNAKIIKVIGQAEFDRLEAKSREIKKWNIPDLTELRDRLKEILKNYKESIK